MGTKVSTRDFYTKERMLRFRMSRTDECERCGEVETYEHLFWGCVESRRVWRSFNEYMADIGHVHRVNLVGSLEENPLAVRLLDNRLCII